MEGKTKPLTTQSIPKIRVMLVDDHAMLRRGLGMFLKSYPDLELVGEAGDGQEAIEKCKELQPDVILMDMAMPVMNGHNATQMITKILPRVKVIALTSYSEARTIQDALKAGAIGYLLKNISPDELANAVRAAFKGQATLATEAAQALVDHSREPQLEDYNLTSRERDVLTLLINGMTNKEIAEKLVVSPSTIKTHVSNILQKLGASSRTEAVAMALNEDFSLE
jgi:NarL family two-component system response regulator LiaR